MAIELLQAPAALATSGNPVVFRVKTTQHAAAGYYLTAFLQAGTDILPEMFLYPDVDGVAEIDVSRFLHNRIRIPLPDMDKASPQPVTGNLLQYRLTFTEHYAGTTESLETGTYTVIRAKLDERILEHTGFSDYMFLGPGYLSMSPVRRETTPDGVHYLCFFAQSAELICRIRATVRTRSGETREYTLGKFGPVGMFTTWYIPVGLHHVSFLNDRKDLQSYTVWIADMNDNIVGKPVEFNIMRPATRTKNLLFENSLGGWDTLPGREQKDTLKVERTDYNLSGGITSLVSEFTNTIECTSGYVTRHTAEMYKELLTSEHVCLAGDVFTEIIPEKGTFTVVDETDDLYAVSFKYKPARVSALIREYATPVILPGKTLLADQHDHQVTTLGGEHISVPCPVNLKL